ncbi:MAG: hypothetical protein WD872_18585 [Pirellulaceae bacterium]
MPSALFFTSDLMFSSQLLGAAATLGLKLHLIANPAGAAANVPAECRLAIIDLGLPGLNLPQLVADLVAAAPGALTVAYGPHVDEQALAAAQSAGVKMVLSRGQFHRQYVDLLRAAAAAT